MPECRTLDHQFERLAYQINFSAGEPRVERKRNGSSGDGVGHGGVARIGLTSALPSWSLRDGRKVLGTRNLVIGHRLDYFVPHGGVPSSGETDAIGEPRGSTRRLDTWQNEINVSRELGGVLGRYCFTLIKNVIQS